MIWTLYAGNFYYFAESCNEKLSLNGRKKIIWKKI